MLSFIGKRKTILSVFWLIFTVSLGIWWFYLSLANINRLILLSQELGSASLQSQLEGYERQRTMIILEGSVFMFMLITGGITMVWLVYRDSKRHHLIQDFFSTVTHEMKTPLTSLQLQVESMIEDFSGKPAESRLKKILNENRRIERQMNKAFYLASLMRSEKLYFEEVSLRELMQSMTYDWKELKYNIDEKFFVWLDIRALESILKNIFENAVTHGQAKLIEVSARRVPGFIELEIQDDGIGFDGNINKLGRPFMRYSKSSGSGIGYYIIFSLLKKMKSSIRFTKINTHGFAVVLSLKSISEISNA